MVYPHLFTANLGLDFSQYRWLSRGVAAVRGEKLKKRRPLEPSAWLINFAHDGLPTRWPPMRAADGRAFEGGPPTQLIAPQSHPGPVAQRDLSVARVALGQVKPGTYYRASASS